MHKNAFAAGHNVFWSTDVILGVKFVSDYLDMTDCVETLK